LRFPFKPVKEQTKQNKTKQTEEKKRKEKWQKKPLMHTKALVFAEAAIIQVLVVPIIYTIL
jgi:hypothetical protein